MKQMNLFGETPKRPILIITGEMSGWRVARLERLGWGRCLIERIPDPYCWSEPWMLDNGAFRFWRQGKKFDEAWYQEVLDRATWCRQHQDGDLCTLECNDETPWFLVAPDVPMDGQASLELTKRWLPKLYAYPGATLAVLQDGMTDEDVMELLGRDDVDGLFLGGSNEFKAKTAHRWPKLARYYPDQHTGRPRWLHYGRCSTPRKLEQAIAAGYNSADSAFILWTDARFIEYAKAWIELTGHPEGAALLAWLEQGAPAEEAA